MHSSLESEGLMTDRPCETCRHNVPHGEFNPEIRMCAASPNAVQTIALSRLYGACQGGKKWEGRT